MSRRMVRVLTPRRSASSLPGHSRGVCSSDSRLSNRADVSLISPLHCALRTETILDRRYVRPAGILRPMRERKIECWLSDMDGVLVHEGRPVPGADRFLAALTASGRRFLVLTNNSIYTPRDLAARLRMAGLEVPVEAIWTSALATAEFL